MQNISCKAQVEVGVGKIRWWEGHEGVVAGQERLGVRKYLLSISRIPSLNLNFEIGYLCIEPVLKAVGVNLHLSKKIFCFN